MSEDPLRSMAMIIILILINAFVSAAEAALSSINVVNVKKKAEEGDQRAEKLLKMFQANASYISAVEFLLASFNILIGIIFAFSHYDLILGFIRTKMPQAGETAVSVVMILIVLVLLYVNVLIGFLFPKKLAIKNAEKTAYSFGAVLKAVTFILYPVLWILEKNVKFLLWLFRVKPEELEENVTEEEIISILNEGQEKGVLEAEEAEMISNIIEFDEKEVKDIMTHRKKIIGINVETTVEDALHFMVNESYSRFPIYQENIDDIIGILHLKDVMKYHMTPTNKERTLKEIAVEPYFVPDTQNIDSLLNEMQAKKIHMAVVIDEYGQTAGLVTMEDILEEIVGDIQDEHDDEEEQILEQGDDSFLVTGDTPLDEVKERIGIELDDEEDENYDTLNGLLISKLDRIPSDGETAVIEIAGYSFEILDTKQKMIQQVKISKTESDTEDEPDKEEQTVDD